MGNREGRHPSSFPSGGLRATFEARGYTAWDPTSYAFIKDKTLCIPTAFCSCCPDLVYTGRTLFGAKPPKGQELDDHYFGSIKPKVAEYMADLDEELWKLGIYSKTEHNEVAPAQHELAPIFSTTNIATDHNQLTMEVMQKVAKRHGLACLLHEKPFAGVNGSGKHNNWSISTNTGVNLLEPGDTPHENAQFLLFLVAVIKAVDDYQELLRVSVATAGNDHRLGANEAPPAVVSMFVGEELEGILEAIEKDEPYDTKEKDVMKVGVHVLPRFAKDTTDRNRTSPFAFTGNKFEFRMPGSALSISGPNVVLNTAVAEELRQFADELEEAADFNSALHELIKKTIREHKRIIFNGNGYDDEWLEEAARRGLANLRTTPDALPAFISEKSVSLFQTHKVFTKEEIEARYEILLENYCKVLSIEANTMLDMARREILPAASEYSSSLASAAVTKKTMNPAAAVGYEEKTSLRISDLTSDMLTKAEELEDELMKAKSCGDTTEEAVYFKDHVLPAMNALRIDGDALETVTSREYWPYPTYGEMLITSY